MNKWKEFCNKLKTPNLAFSIIFSLLAIAIITSTIILCIVCPDSIFSYIMYGLSAFTLTYLVYLIVYYAPKIKNSIANSMRKHKFTNELLESYGYRSVIFAIISFIINIAYAISQAVLAILAGSIWYGALATYYIAISLIRGGVVAVSRKRKQFGEDFTLEKQIKSYRNCGIYIVLLNFALVGGIVQMVITNQGFEYAGIMIYVMSAYTFYKLILAIYNLFKAKKHNDYTIQSIKNINFADALVSILALQTAMLQAFSSNYNTRIPNSITGGAVSLLIIAMGIYMIVTSNKKLKNLQKEKENEQKV